MLIHETVTINHHVLEVEVEIDFCEGDRSVGIDDSFDIRIEVEKFNEFCVEQDGSSCNWAELDRFAEEYLIGTERDREALIEAACMDAEAERFADAI